MDVFALRNRVLGDYHRYVESFLEIKDERIHEFVKSELAGGVLWPEALVQLNPSYEKGRTVEELVEEGLLHPLCRKIFRDEKTGGSIHLFKHQEELGQQPA